MKRNISILSAFAALAILATGCSKEDNNGSAVDQKGEKGLIQLTINTRTPATRAAGEGTGAALADELTVDPAQGLTVVIFNEDGSLAYAKQEVPLVAGTNTGEYVTSSAASDAIEVNAGNLSYFVFANNKTNVKVTAPAYPGSTTRDAFMVTTFTPAFTGNVLDIATADNFLLGSLWSQTTLTAGGGTTAAPIVVTIPAIGRLSSKVVLGSVVVDKTTQSTLAGTFSAPEFRPGTVANAINYAGVHTGALLPYSPNTGVLVTSAKHTAPYELNAGQGDFNSTDFIANTDFAFKAVTATAAASAPDAADVTANAAVPFFVTENTTALNANTGAQYYGNTTYIQIKTVYTPAATETYAVNGTAIGAVGATLTDGDFWTGVTATEGRLIYNADPSGIAGIDDVKFFDGGANYHKFPVFDTNETMDIYKNRVLRNHLYTFDVTGINDLGEHTGTVDPTEPIATVTTIEINVKVANWDKVTTGSVEL